MKYLTLAAALALAACQPEPAKPTADPAPPAETPAAPVTPAQPSGPPRTIESATDESLLSAASVTDVHFVKDADVKLFSTAGGDPAINGLYTYLALFTAPDGWTRIFMLGDFNSWDVIEESPTRVVLKISRSWIEEGTGDIKTAEEKLIVDVPAAEATTITVTPAS